MAPANTVRNAKKAVKAKSKPGAPNFLAETPWAVVLALCATLGLAPFTPPHVVDKLAMLFQGELQRPIDWFDLVLHGAPWLALIAKGVAACSRR